ncbi:hypothetical protein QBC47DRAFT_61495 [Echria macrotheca]|uniref:Uncharacterized protein n=1 Tax=Echria macrotheca TaxID=438768 RepID=A0AAJ0F8Z8_9PEZI|nr:hypothetical protein QBC47DRAFT_61495 [Echria macrotheca]
MNNPANIAVREQRRRSSAFDVEQMNVMKALTAAEYSRRQFVLNFAASKDTQLLVPGQKADAIKEAEEWAVSYLNQNGFSTVTNDFFKYTVDARLWNKLVGPEPDFPFAFMRRAFEPSTPSIDSENTASNAAPRPGSEVFSDGYDIGVTRLDQVLTRESTQPELPPARRPSKLEQRERERTDTLPEQNGQPPARQRSSKKKEPASEGEGKRRSLSTYGFEDLKMTKKLNQDKFPLLVRLGRSFSRRMSG